MRQSVRSIAKARLEAMNVPHINKVFGMNLSHTKNRKYQKSTGLLEKLRKEHPPLWRRVTNGSLAQKGREAQFQQLHKKGAHA